MHKPLLFSKLNLSHKCFWKLQMLAALRNSPDSMSMSSMKDYIDPNMMDLYPHDCLFKVNINYPSESLFVINTVDKISC